MDPLLKEIRHNPMLWLLALVPVALVTANTGQSEIPACRRSEVSAFTAPSSAWAALSGPVDRPDLIEDLAAFQLLLLTLEPLRRDQDTVNGTHRNYTISLWENDAAMRAYENGEVLQNTILPRLKPFFSGDYTTTRCEVRFAEEFD